MSTPRDRWLVTTALDGGISYGHLLGRRFQAWKDREKGQNKDAKVHTESGKPSHNKGKAQKDRNLGTFGSSDGAESLATRVTKEGDRKKEEEEGLEENADSKQLLESTILDGDIGRGDGAVLMIPLWIKIRKFALKPLSKPSRVMGVCLLLDNAKMTKEYRPL